MQVLIDRVNPTERVHGFMGRSNTPEPRTAAVHEQMWRLLLDTSGFRDPSSVDARVRAAILEVDQWDEPKFRVASATLRHEFPEQHDFLFADDLQPGNGAESLLSVSIFLDRLDVLERGVERKSTRKADAAALAKLAVRGITPEERARIRGLVDIARSSVADTAEAMAQDRTAGRKSLEQLRALYEEWAEIARVVVKRRVRVRHRDIATGGYVAFVYIDVPASQTYPAWVIDVSTLRLNPTGAAIPHRCDELGSCHLAPREQVVPAHTR